MPLSRRGFLIGAASALAAPAIVRAELLMPVRKLVVPTESLIVSGLDDYEEGTFTWTIERTYPSGGVGYYTVPAGKYVRIGDLIHATGSLG